VTVAWLMLFGGFCLAVAGWKNVSVLEVLRGHFDVPKQNPSAGAGSGGQGK
jgi:hypothetical protein